MILRKLPPTGAAAEDVMRQAILEWAAAATAAGNPLRGFDPTASLNERLAWATKNGFSIGVGCSRYSSDKSSSTLTQVLEIVRFAAQRKIYIPPEFLCVDEAVTGRKSRRAGLDRAKQLLLSGQGQVLVIYKLSRLMRTCYKSVAFVQEEIVDNGLRAVSVTQNVDTQDEANWRKLVYLYGMMDEALITTIADHVRSSLKTLFQQGFSVGALPAGYDRIVVEGALTKLGRPRTKPALNDAFCAMFRRHVALHLGGMSLADGHRMWIANGGARDPRSDMQNRMSYTAYRRMLSNPRYAGAWAFGSKKNVWNHKHESAKQIDQPDENIVLVFVDELAAISPKTFARLQRRLAENKQAPRAAKKKGPKSLWDFTTRYFVCGCPTCLDHDKPYYQGRNTNPTMACKSGTHCPQHVTVRRDKAVRLVCEALQSLVVKDSELLVDLVAEVGRLDADDTLLNNKRDELQRRHDRLSRQISALLPMLGEGNEQDRHEVKMQLKSAQNERAEIVPQLRGIDADAAARVKLEEPQIRMRAADLHHLLHDAAAGRLGEDAVYQAVRVFELLTGGRIVVTVEQRPGRKRPVVRGTFTPMLLRAILDDEDVAAGGQPRPMSVWLRPPPQSDRLAEQVHQLVDIKKFSFPKATKILREQGEKLTDSAVERAYRRYYQIRNEQPPKRPYNNGCPRKAAPHRAEDIADEVVRLMNEEKIHLKQIAIRLGVKPWVITEAKEHWFTSRGLTVPDGRSRRKTLQLKDVCKV